MRSFVKIGTGYLVFVPVTSSSLSSLSITIILIITTEKNGFW